MGDGCRAGGVVSVYVVGARASPVWLGGVVVMVTVRGLGGRGSLPVVCVCVCVCS